MILLDSLLFIISQKICGMHSNMLLLAPLELNYINCRFVLNHTKWIQNTIWLSTFEKFNNETWPKCIDNNLTEGQQIQAVLLALPKCWDTLKLTMTYSESITSFSHLVPSWTRRWATWILDNWIFRFKRTRHDKAHWEKS